MHLCPMGCDVDDVHMRFPARVASAAALVVVSVTLAACAGDQKAMPLTVVGTEMAFTAPDRVSAGRYAVTFRNEGTTYHELALKDPSGAIAMRRSIPAGQQVVIDLDLEPGTWELGCFEPGHYEGGMHRPLVVDPA
jgi:uncharacterized cupredoxin-like copper-binding protein